MNNVKLQRDCRGSEKYLKYDEYQTHWIGMSLVTKNFQTRFISSSLIQFRFTVRNNSQHGGCTRPEKTLLAWPCRLQILHSCTTTLTICLISNQQSLCHLQWIYCSNIIAHHIYITRIKGRICQTHSKMNWGLCFEWIIKQLQPMVNIIRSDRLVQSLPWLSQDTGIIAWVNMSLQCWFSHCSRGLN